MASPAKPDRLLIASAGSIVLAVVVVAVQLPAVLAAVFGSGMGKDQPQEVLAKLMDEHDTEMSTYQARFNGRSLFFKPPAPAPPPRPVPPPPDEDPPPPPPPPASTVYTGPSVVAILGDEVWFRAPRRGVGRSSRHARLGADRAALLDQLFWRRCVAQAGNTFRRPWRVQQTGDCPLEESDVVLASLVAEPDRPRRIGRQNGDSLPLVTDSDTQAAFADARCPEPDLVAENGHDARACVHGAGRRGRRRWGVLLRRWCDWSGASGRRGRLEEE